ncbi:ABC transporter permease [Pseudonocardia tropica]|uniref:ABC transporter permease n=1 Tax=Pseudonocardia tropica TaxID=681289 RepID=A0ABV1JQR4_9PSEU
MTTVQKPPTGAGRSAPSGTRGRALADAGPALALVVLCLVFAVATPGFATPENLRAILDQAAIPLILATGISLVVLTGGIDLSVEGVMAASGLTFVLLARNSVTAADLGWGALLVGVGCGALFGLANGVLHVVGRVPSFIVTLGTWFVGLGTATVLFGSVTPELLDENFRGWAGATVAGIPLFALVAVLVVVLAVVTCRSTRFGRTVLAVGGDERIARLAGLPTGRVKIAVFTLAGIASGLAGVLATIRLGAGDVAVGSGTLFLTLSAVVLGGTLLAGGRGGPLHTVAGVFLLVVLGNGLLLLGAEPWVQQAVQALILVAAVVAGATPVRHRMRVIK